ncbi:MAG: VOC family protein [Pseudonocardiaceae bacterium]|nr:VOC family protein [Pseudonocardiaceae bacterium]
MSTVPELGCVVLDCPEPMSLARFYAGVLGWSVDADSDDDWATVRSPDGGPTLGFQRDQHYAPPTWPDPQRPQMLHLDLTSTDLDADERRVLDLGARPLPSPDGGSFRVYADPVGHPFCLCAC